MVVEVTGMANTAAYSLDRITMFSPSQKMAIYWLDGSSIPINPICF